MLEQAIFPIFLNYEGFETVTSPDGDNYENLIRQNSIDLIIIDYLLPGINGGEICHQIKCNTEFAHLPVILFSAYPKVLQSLGSYGCDTFIPKPFDLADIVGQITKLLHCESNKFLQIKLCRKRGRSAETSRAATKGLLYYPSCASSGRLPGGINMEAVDWLGQVNRYLQKDMC